MKKQFQSYSFWIPLLLFIAHQIIQHILAIEIPLLDKYLDPFCLAAIVLHLLSVEHAYLYQKAKLDWLEIAIVIIYLCIITEMLFPYLSDSFVADGWDCVAIVFGGLWFVVGSRGLVGR